MTKIRINTKDKEYECIIGRDLLTCLPEQIIKTIGNGRAYIITDTNVAKIYLNTLTSALDERKIEHISYIMQAGEKHKNIDTVADILNDMAYEGVCRTDTVIALGGGVVGDVAGLCASLYMRGIKLIHIPTTLLAMIDSSIGGKNGCDLDAGKNLAGTFYQPSAVLIDVKCLETLDDRYIKDAMGEAVKYALLDRDFYDYLIDFDGGDYESLIEKCVLIKRKFVEDDERDRGIRKMLNLGHTLAHAIEKFYNYEKFTHGEAVAIGICAIQRAAAKNSLASPDISKKVAALCEKFGLIREIDDIKRILPLCINDKKRSGDEIDLIYIRDIGEPTDIHIKTDDLAEFFGEEK